MEIVSKSATETQKIAVLLAREVAALKGRHAVVLALTGNLGAGKTTFVQGFAGALGIKEKIASPTFVIMKAYSLTPKTSNVKPRMFVHIDAYRLKSGKDLEALGIHAILRDPHTIVLIEWAERVKRLIPSDAIRLTFLHGKGRNERIIQLQIPKSKVQIKPQAQNPKTSF